MADAQRDDGAVPDVCPAYWPIYNDSVTWPSSIAIIPGALLDQDADRGLLDRAYPAIAKWLNHQIGGIKDNIATRDTYADWCEPPESPQLIHSKDPARKTAGPLLATTYLYHCLQLGARYATIVGIPDDARNFEAQADRLRQGLNEHFYRKDLGQYDNGSATSYILPLAFDMVPEADRTRVMARLVDKIMKDNDGHGSHGLVGGQWVNRVLTRYGHGDVAYAMATQTTYPSLEMCIRDSFDAAPCPIALANLRLADPLWLLAVLALPMVLWLRGRTRVSVLLVPFAAAWHRASIVAASNWTAGCAVAGLVLLIAALARPQKIEDKRDVRTQGFDIVLAIDLSGSMLSEDYEKDGERINRLQAIKRCV